MSEKVLAVELRDGTGKSVTRKIRRAGRVPAVIYGHGKATLSLSFDPKSLESILKASDAGVNTLIGLEGDSAISGKTVLVKELQRDPIDGFLMHADLFEVDPEEKISVSVPVHVVGTAEGITMGGILDHALREVELECLPSAIPDAIELDVTALSLGDSIHVRDLVVAEGISVRTHDELPVVSVILPTVVEEEPAVSDEALEGDAAEGEGGEDGPAASGDSTSSETEGD
ncbi:MAG: 50S ribosomal protein L25 [Myxococcota bacterium]|nr:50S ribosomal protein L25 [Myxococcota bacterium]